MNDTILTKAWAESLTFIEVFNLSEEMAERLFLLLRWPESKGARKCPICSSTKAYWIQKQKHHQCHECRKHYRTRTCTTFARCKVNNHAAVCFIYASIEGISAKEIHEKTGIDFKTVYHWLAKIKKDLGGSIYIPTQESESNPRVSMVRKKYKNLETVERSEVAKFLLSGKKLTSEDALNHFQGFCEESVLMHFKDLYFKKPLILKEVSKGKSAFVESQNVILPLQNGDYHINFSCGYK